MTFLWKGDSVFRSRLVKSLYQTESVSLSLLGDSDAGGNVRSHEDRELCFNKCNHIPIFNGFFMLLLFFFFSVGHTEVMKDGEAAQMKERIGLLHSHSSLQVRTNFPSSDHKVKRY